jgi:GH35 family endo-1,4-beta-xylanase
MDKVSDKKVQRRASHKKRVWTIRVWGFKRNKVWILRSQGNRSRLSHLALPYVKKGKPIQFIHLDTLQLKFKCIKY